MQCIKANDKEEKRIIKGFCLLSFAKECCKKLIKKTLNKYSSTTTQNRVLNNSSTKEEASNLIAVGILKNQQKSKFDIQPIKNGARRK